MRELVRRWLEFVGRNSRKVVAVALLLTALAALATSRLKLSSDITRLFPADVPEVRQFTVAAETFGLTDQLVLLVTVDSTQEQEVTSARHAYPLGSLGPGSERSRREPRPPGEDATPAEDVEDRSLALAASPPHSAQVTEDDLLYFSRKFYAALLAEKNLFRPPKLASAIRQIARTLALDCRALLMLPQQDFEEFLRRLQPENIEKLVAAEAARLAAAPPLPAAGERAKDVLKVGELLGGLARSLLLKTLPTAAGAGVGIHSPAIAFPTFAPWRNDAVTDEEPVAPLLVSSTGGRPVILVSIEGAGHARDTASARKTLERVVAIEDETRRHCAEHRVNVGAIRVHKLGGYVVSLENEDSMRHDIALAITAGVAMVFALLLLFLKSLRVVLMMTVCFGLSVTWTFGLAGLACPAMNTVTIAFVAALAGLAVDLSIHLCIRFSSERAGGRNVSEAGEATFYETGGGVLGATATTVAAFGVLAFSSFPGLAWLGLLIAAGMTFALAANYTMLPVLLMTAGTSADTDKREEKKHSLVERISSAIARRRTMTILGFCALTAAGVFGLTKLNFESDARKLGHISAETREAQELFSQAFPGFVEPFFLLHAARDTTSLIKESKKAGELLAGFEAEGVVRGKFSVCELLPSEEAQLKRIEQLAALDDKTLRATLSAALEKNGFVSKNFEDYIEWIVGVVSTTRPLSLFDLTGGDEDALVRFVTKGGVSRSRDGGNQCCDHEGAVLSRSPSETARLPLADARGSVPPSESRLGKGSGADDPPDALLALSYVWPDRSVNSPAARREFAARLSALFAGSPSAWEQKEHESPAKANAGRSETGTTLVGFSVMMDAVESALRREVWWISLAAVVAVLALVLLQFRSVGWTALAVLPVTCGLLVGAGIMWLAGLNLNYLSAAFFPVIAGIGVDDGIHIVHRFRAGRSWGEPASALLKKVMSEAGVGVVLTSLTTIAGFGSLALASNPLLASLGLTVSIGVGACLLTSLFFLPAVILVVAGRRQHGTELRA